MDDQSEPGGLQSERGETLALTTSRAKNL
ncbi:Protein of unknown function [Pyronema omphalodes CBS 100304]|uniref:Uncharacterized protein n=1 Tax=Pyronema omphalodes (strain CBS 100304) TaxID=1076935 RepID=U4L4A6_PYROM|nr:Protein of unknown function [Pyronema omphalodes CBS 100304]